MGAPNEAAATATATATAVPLRRSERTTATTTGTTTHRLRTTQQKPIVQVDRLADGTTRVTRNDLAALPPYQPPTSGILARAPRWMLPYLELARVTNPGFMIVSLIYIIGAAHAAIVHNTPPRELAAMSLWLTPMAAATIWGHHAWNDVCDVDVDALVARCRFRPLVRGALSTPQALAFVAFLAAIIVVLLIPLPAAAKWYTGPIMLLGMPYPYMKRITNYPQVYLGISMAPGVIIGAAAAGQRPFAHPHSLSEALASSFSKWRAADGDNGGTASLLALTLVVAIWVVVVELIYSYQDADWDEAAGVGTMTRIFPSRPAAKTFLYALTAVNMLCFAYAGELLGADRLRWSLWTVCFGFALGGSTYRVNLDDPDDCLRWFATSSATGLGSILAAVLNEYVRRQ